MRALLVTSYDGPSAVEVGDLPAPVPGGDEVLVDVEASGVTWPDLLHTRGAYQTRPALPFAIGCEVAGTVRTAPAGSGFSPGQRVAALTLVGGHAEQVAVPVAQVVPLPDEVPSAPGACLAMNLLTVHYALVHRGHLRAGDVVLVHGAAGGIGTAAVQLSVALGARVLAVVSSPAKREAALASGAHEVLTPDEAQDRSRELTGGRGVDLVVDPVGADRVDSSIRSLAPQGRLLLLGFTGGEIANVAVNRVLMRNIDLVGVHWGPHVLAHPGFLGDQWTDLLPHLRSGAVLPTVSYELGLDDGARALTMLDERAASGRIVLRPGRPGPDPVAS